MAELAASALSACPNTKLVLSGYSQGAMVVHNALSSGSLSGSDVAAVLAFGDPLNGSAFEGVDDSKVLQVCGSEDFICSRGGSSVDGSHLSYSDDGQTAAEFAVEVCPFPSLPACLWWRARSIADALVGCRIVGLVVMRPAWLTAFFSLRDTDVLVLSASLL